MDELDNYVSNFDPHGSSYIVCPACSKPIQNCMRYESINRKRNVKREAEKARLQGEKKISRQEREKLQLSQAELEDSAFLAEFHKMNIGILEHKNEVKAASFKLKCAFVMSKIFSLEEDDPCNPESARPLKSRKDALLRVHNRLTDQQKNEFTTEMLRSFWFAYLSKLERLCSTLGVLLPHDFQVQVKGSKDTLGQLRPDEHTLESAKTVAAVCRRRIEEMASPSVKDQCLDLEQTSTKVMKVMRSRDDQMMWDLLCPRGSENIAKNSSGQAFPVWTVTPQIFYRAGRHRKRSRQKSST